MPTLVVRSPDGAQKEHEIRDELTIGRAEENDLVLPAGGVSRRHARIYVQDGQVLVEDAGSANGTFLDGEKLSGPAPLKPRCQLVVGDYHITLKPDVAGGSPKKVPP